MGRQLEFEFWDEKEDFEFWEEQVDITIEQNG